MEHKIKKQCLKHQHKSYDLLKDLGAGIALAMLIWLAACIAFLMGCV